MGKNHLANFTDAFSKRRFKGSVVRGLRAIPVSRIIGSVNRSQDYYYDFTKISEGDRTREIERMMSRGVSLPPIDVFQIGDYYYVEDGHHRVAIAKKLKQEFIDAYITQYFFWSYEDYFHGKLGFTDIECSRPSHYKRLLDDIRDFRQERYDERYVDFKQAAEEWHREKYVPAITKIRESGIEKLKEKTVADHYCRYLRLKREPKFAALSFGEILEYMVKRYESPLYFMDRIISSIIKGVVRICKRVIRRQTDEINPSA